MIFPSKVEKIPLGEMAYLRPGMSKVCYQSTARGVIRKGARCEILGRHEVIWHAKKNR
jgi:hypothetical protein